jgi:hypothetical protein
VGVKALSSDSRIADSEMSNILTLNEPLADMGYGMVGGLRGLEMLAGQGGPLAALLGDDTDADDGFPVHVIRLTDAAIHLDWSQYQSPSTLVYYRVVWSSASNAAVSVRLPLCISLADYWSKVLSSCKCTQDVTPEYSLNGSLCIGMLKGRVFKLICY